MKRFAALTATLLALSLFVPGSAAATGGGRTATPSSTADSTIRPRIFLEGNYGNFNVPIGTGRRGTTADFVWSGNLPKGLVLFHNGDGRNATLAGMPAIGSAGTYPLTITSFDSKGGLAVQKLSVTVEPIASNVPIVVSVS